MVYDASWERDSSRPATSDGAEVTGVPALMAREPRPSRWDNVSWFHTSVPITATKTCQLFTFTGPTAESAAGSIDELAPSLRLVG